ncbi:MAG TPA: hypothetical protein VEU77_00725 [Candidatus Acidoferrales bacterium]|nr:hypothetical protein [Candidatus Acidoferrales bacterium]
MTALRWLALTIVAYAAGASLAVAAMNAVARPMGPLGAGGPFIFLFGAIVGVAVGAVQYLGLWRRVALAAWLGASALGAAIGYVLAAVVGEQLGNVISPTGNIVVGGGTIQDLSGLVLGLAIGVAQWRVLRGPLGVGRWWIVATAIGVSLGYGTAAAVLELLEVDLLKVNLIPSYGAIVGLGAGIAQVIVLWSRRSRVPA